MVVKCFIMFMRIAIFGTFFLSCATKDQIMANNDQAVLKEVREFIEPGYWIDKNNQVATVRRLKTISHYNSDGQLYQKVVQEFGTEEEPRHAIDVKHESTDGTGNEAGKEVILFTSETWDFEKQEIRMYDTAGLLTAYREVIIDEAGEEVLKDCTLRYGENGKAESQICKVSWGDNIIYKYFYDEKGFLIKQELWDEQESIRDGAEAYDNDEFGNPLKRTTYASDREGGKIVEVATYENTYW